MNVELTACILSSLHPVEFCANMVFSQQFLILLTALVCLPGIIMINFMGVLVSSILLQLYGYIIYPGEGYTVPNTNWLPKTKIM